MEVAAADGLASNMVHWRDALIHAASQRTAVRESPDGIPDDHHLEARFIEQTEAEDKARTDAPDTGERDAQDLREFEARQALDRLALWDQEQRYGDEIAQRQADATRAAEIEHARERDEIRDALIERAEERQDAREAEREERQDETQETETTPHAEAERMRYKVELYHLMGALHASPRAALYHSRGMTI